MKKALLKPEYIACLFFVAILVFFIFKPLFIGVADNGDFYRALAGNGLYYINFEPYSFVQTQFGIVDATIKDFYVTTHSVLIQFAIFLNKLVYSHTYFDIRFLAFIYSVILLLAVFFAVKAFSKYSMGFRWLLASLIVIVFGDIGYLAYFNSLYGEPVTYVTLLLAISLFLYIINKEKPPILGLIAFFCAMIFFVGAKQQNFPIALAVAVLGFRLISAKKDVLWKILCVALSIITILVSLITLRGISDEIKEINIHQAVFFGILRDSKTVESDLKDLGLNPEKLAPLAGTTYFDSKGEFAPEGEFMEDEFFSKISYKNIVQFYLTHPLRFIEKMNVTANHSFTIVQKYTGNFAKSSGKPANENICGIWSGTKSLFFNNLIFLLILATLLLYFLFSERKGKTAKEKLMTDLLLFVFFIAVFAFVMPYVADGDGDLSKHLFLFNITFDVLFIASILWCYQKITNKHKKLQ